MHPAVLASFTRNFNALRPGSTTSPGVVIPSSLAGPTRVALSLRAAMRGAFRLAALLAAGGAVCARCVRRVTSLTDDGGRGGGAHYAW